jgi:hypothetical protein
VPTAEGDVLCCRVRDIRAATVFVSYSGHFSVSADSRGKNALTNFRGERFIVQLQSDLWLVYRERFRT